LKVLILKPSSLGDVIHSLPILRLLRRHYPNALIQWWIDSRLAVLLQDDPDLNGVIPFHRDRWASPLHWLELSRSIGQMRRQKFDLVLDLQGLARSGVFAWLANGAYTVGVDDPREGAAGFYDRAVPRPGKECHAVDWYLEVLRTVNVPVNWKFEWIPERSAVAQRVRQWLPQGKRVVALIPGARWDNKRWPAEHFVQLATRLRAKFPDCLLAVLGGASDANVGQQIAKALPGAALNFTGATSLLEMIELIRLSELVITNDTGPLHVADALQKPLVALFGPTDPQRTGPYFQRDHVLRRPLRCAPCMRSRCQNPIDLQCLKEITPESVSAVAATFLSR
jgi:lipopolysaccharide heptosyltransferase I